MSLRGAKRHDGRTDRLTVSCKVTLTLTSQFPELLRRRTADKKGYGLICIA